MDILTLILAKNYTNKKIAEVASGFVYKGAVNYRADLDNIAAEIGHIYTVKYKGTSGTEPWNAEFVYGNYEGTNTWIELGPDYAADIEALKNNKLDKPTEPVAGQGLNVPYYFDVEYHESDAIVKDYTIDLLDKTKAPQQFQMRITAASEQQAGLLQAVDKVKLDRLNQVDANPESTGEEIDLTRIKIGSTNYKIPTGGSGEPDAYIKSAAVSTNGHSLTLTKKDDTTVTFTPGAFSPFPAEFVTNKTTKEFGQSVVNHSSFKAGMAWYGELRCSDLPNGLINIECTVKAMTDTIAVIELSSSNREPYHWEYNTDSFHQDDHADWKLVPCILQSKCPTETNVNYDLVVKKNSKDGIETSTVKSLTAGDNITIDANRKINAVDTKYTAGTNITIDENNVISATGGGGEPAAYLLDAEVDENNHLKINNKLGQEVVNCSVNYTLDNAKVKAVLTEAEKETLLSGVTGTTWIAAQTNISSLQSGKQDKLTAGENITISADNVISATGSGSGNVDSITVGGEKLLPENKDVKIVLGNSLAYSDQEPGLGYKNLHVNFKSTHGLEVDGTNGLKVKVNQESKTITLDANGLKVADTVITDIATKAKLPDKLPDELKTEGVEYPWFMINLNPKAIDAAGNLILDHSGYNFNTKQYYTWKDKSIPMAATEATGGLMKASDAKAVRTDLPNAISNEINRATSVETGLDTRIQNLESRGRFLSSWDASTGLPTDYPTIEKGGEYSYKAGDYYIISSVPTSGDKYQPDGTKITRDSEGTYNIPKKTETREIAVGDYYNYTTSGWVWIQNTQKTVNFSQIAGNARDSINLKGELETLEAADTTLSNRIGTLEDISHSHTNKVLLDSYTQTDADIEAAVQQRHSHSNKEELDKIESGDKAKWDTASNKSHNHINKNTLDDITTENLLDAGQKNKLTGIESGAQVNKIEVVKVNGAALDISNKAVNIDLSEKLDKPNEPVVGQGINIPYYFDVSYSADKVTVKDYTIDLLDKSKAPQQFSLDINCANQTNAGLMSAADKKAVDEMLPAYPTDTDGEYILAIKYEAGAWVKYWKEIANKSDLVDKGTVDYMVIKE